MNTHRHHLAQFGIEDRQPLWNTQEPHGTCQRCGEDTTTCRQIGCDDIPHGHEQAKDVA